MAGISRSDENHKSLSDFGFQPSVEKELTKIYSNGILIHSQVAASGGLEHLKCLSTNEALEVLKMVLKSRQEYAPDKTLLLLCILNYYQQKMRLKPSKIKILQPGPDGLMKWIPMYPTFSSSVYDEIEKMLEKYQYKLLITDDMRKCGPPHNFSEIPPSEECEVYCGMISECTNEDTLIPMFVKIGLIWDMKLMTDPSKRHHRGFAFVRYLKPGHALVAARELDGKYEKGTNLVVNIPSMRLLVRNIPLTKTAAQMKIHFENATDGVKDVILDSSPKYRGKNRGSIFVIYDSFASASKAKQVLSSGQEQICERDITPDFDVQDEPDSEDLSKVKVSTFKLL